MRETKETGTIIYANIRAMAEHKGWSDAEVARQAGVSRSNLSALKGGQHSAVTLAILTKFATALEVPVETLTRGTSLQPTILMSAEDYFAAVFALDAVVSRNLIALAHTLGEPESADGGKRVARIAALTQSLVEHLPHNSQVSNEEMVHWLRVFDKLNDEQRKLVLALIEQMK